MNDLERYLARCAQQTAEERQARIEREAARYRWLRDIGDATWRPFGVREGYSAAQADAAIDAAMKAAKGTKA